MQIGNGKMNITGRKSRAVLPSPARFADHQRRQLLGFDPAHIGLDATARTRIDLNLIIQDGPGGFFVIQSLHYFYQILISTLFCALYIGQNRRLLNRLSAAASPILFCPALAHTVIIETKTSRE